MALCSTADRGAAAVKPMTMGVIAAMFGLQASFLVVGGALLGGMVLVVVYVRRTAIDREA